MSTNIDYWKKALANVPSVYTNWFSEEKKCLRKQITKNSKVLDVGCGDGRSIFDFIDITQNVIGLDFDEKAIFDAKQNLLIIQL
jgi:ubiquinone/menaquinone biosynthesis C-methylase UbiE